MAVDPATDRPTEATVRPGRDRQNGGTTAAAAAGALLGGVRPVARLIERVGRAHTGSVGGRSGVGVSAGSMGSARAGAVSAGRSPLGVEAPVEIVLTVAGGPDVVTARGAARALAEDLGFSPTESTMVATAVSELTRNIASYATHGQVRLFVRDHDGRAALVVEAIDDGPGIPDVQRALEDGYSTGRGLGLGLPGARRLMDALEVRCEPGAGTRVTTWKWLPRPGPKSRASRSACRLTAGSWPVTERDRRRIPIQT